VGRTLGRDVILTEDVDEDLPAYKILRRHRVAAVVKMIYADDSGRKKLLGYMLLGEKRRARKFSIKDIQALETIATLAAIAVENVAYYSQLKIQR
jgi:GAF domain-containing protein